jgi:hypothetical protein
VSTIFKAAVGERLVAASPCIGITLPKRIDARSSRTRLSFHLRHPGRRSPIRSVFAHESEITFRRVN